MTSLESNLIFKRESSIWVLTSQVIQVTIGGISSGTLVHLATKQLKKKNG